MLMFTKALIVARYTFQEMLKSKILWNVALLGFGIALMTFVAAEFTFGVPDRVALDLGLGSLTLSSYGITLLIGINLIRKEEESRTVYLIISRPVSRVAFLIGKMLGVSTFLVLNLFLLSLVTVGVVLSLGGNISSLALTAMFFSMLEAIMLLSVVVALSLLANQAIALMGAILLLVVGHAINETQSILYVQLRPWLSNVVELYHLVLPGFYRFNLKDLVLYQQELATDQIVRTFFYWLFYTTGLISCSAWILNRKNLD